MPSWASFNATTGVLSGTPAFGTGGVYTFTIDASNIGAVPADLLPLQFPGLPDSYQTFTLTVDQAPVINSTAGTTFTVGTPGSFQVTTATGTFPTTAVTFSATGVPAGVMLSPTGLLSGTPSGGAGGTYNIAITASNGAVCFL